MARPVRFRAERVIKGEVPDCLELYVPGGVVGKVRRVHGVLPDVIRAGERYLAFASTHNGVAYTGYLQLVDSKGRARLPIADQGHFARMVRGEVGDEEVDVYTWEPPA